MAGEGGQSKDGPDRLLASSRTPARVDSPSMTTPPRVSILIPNYNNGRESSTGGRRDFLGDLFASLRDTLADDPTPLEIIVADDGSTDDSLETCRVWARETWRGGAPFVRLIELEHCGVLSVVANLLMRESTGDICCRLDGDITVRTPRWAELLVRTFEEGPPDLGVVGPKQLMPSGHVHAAGDWILHPRGYHHVAQGAPASAITRSREVDHVMGCFYCCRREVWERLGGYDETFLRGQTIDFGLRARLDGWRAFAIPTIEFVHYHGERAARSTAADSADGIRSTVTHFADKWGFDRLAPDLDDIAQRYAGTPLLWNAPIFGPSTTRPSDPAATADIAGSDWSRFASSPAFRQSINARLDPIRRLRNSLPPRPRILHVDCGSGLFAHLVAGDGGAVIGVTEDAAALNLASVACEGQSYPDVAPRFIFQTDRRRLPLDDGSVDLVLLIHALETAANPVGLLREARRVLARGGILLVIAKTRRSPLEPDDGLASGYRPHELGLQIESTRCFQPAQLHGTKAIAGALMLIGLRADEDPPSWGPEVRAEIRAPGASALVQ